MIYKETLLFIAKSLTISLEEKNRHEIEFMLKKTNIDWEAVVKVSTSHYVFPTIFYNFKSVNFLKYIPTDLVDYMKDIINLNRDRNTKILQQAKELNRLLNDNGVRPIFLKGTGNLLEGLYKDLGERMVGDIDLLFTKKDLQNAIKILKSHGYYNPDDPLNHFPGHLHYPRMVKEGHIAAVEIHKEVIIDKYRREFSSEINCDGARISNEF